jgi:hypothetical protein
MQLPTGEDSGFSILGRIKIPSSQVKKKKSLICSKFFLSRFPQKKEGTIKKLLI